MLDTDIFLGGIMSENYDADLRREIEYFKRTGKLLGDRDVRFTKPGRGDHSLYWDWVRKSGSREEPLYNSGEVPVEEEGATTNKGERFSQWLKEGFEKLSDDDKELFRLAFELRLDVKDIAGYLKVKPVTVYKRIEKLKGIIALAVGISM